MGGGGGDLFIQNPVIVNKNCFLIRMLMVWNFLHEIREEIVGGGDLFIVHPFIIQLIQPAFYPKKNDRTINVVIRILELFCLPSFELKYVNA